MDSPKRFLDTLAAAAILGLKPQTLRFWRHAGNRHLPYSRIGRQVRYDEADIYRLLERSKCTCTADAKACTMAQSRGPRA